MVLALCQKLACSVSARGAQLELNFLSHQAMRAAWRAGMPLEVSDVEESGSVPLNGVRISDADERRALF